MQKNGEGKQEDRKNDHMNQYCSLTGLWGYDQTLCVCECGSVKLTGNIPTSPSGWARSTNTGNNPRRLNKQLFSNIIRLNPDPNSCTTTTTSSRTRLTVGLVGDLYGGLKESLPLAGAHQSHTLSGQCCRSVGRKESSNPTALFETKAAEHFVHCSFILRKKSKSCCCEIKVSKQTAKILQLHSKWLQSTSQRLSNKITSEKTTTTSWCAFFFKNLCPMKCQCTECTNCCFQLHKKQRTHDSPTTRWKGSLRVQLLGFIKNKQKKCGSRALQKSRRPATHTWADRTPTTDGKPKWPA